LPSAAIPPTLFERDHAVVVHHAFLLIEGTLQNRENTISVKAERVQLLFITQAEIASHDFR
jgi:hypothetical protein